MGLSADRAYKLQCDMKSRLLDIIGMAISCKMTHSDICDRVRKDVMSEAARRGAPQHVISYIRGIYDTRMDDMYRYHIVWTMYVDGKLRTSQEVRAMCDREAKLKKSKSLDYKSPYARVDSDKSVHVWTDSKGTVLYDRPFNSFSHIIRAARSRLETVGV